jgi:serine/threonine protein kinase
MGLVKASSSARASSGAASCPRTKSADHERNRRRAVRRHAVSIIHRDIKPDNILLEGTRGRVMVTDFGIAKAVSQASGSTLTGWAGHRDTAAHESGAGGGERDLDGRSDLYSLGVVAYQMTCGERHSTPRLSRNPDEADHRAGAGAARDQGGVPKISLAIARCLEKDPEQRWPTADSLRRSLESRTVTGYRPTTAAVRVPPRASGTRPRPTGRGTEGQRVRGTEPPRGGACSRVRGRSSGRGAEGRGAVRQEVVEKERTG